MFPFERIKNLKTIPLPNYNGYINLSSLMEPKTNDKNDMLSKVGHPFSRLPWSYIQHTVNESLIYKTISFYEENFEFWHNTPSSPTWPKIYPF